MSRIRGCDTGPEMILRREIRRHGKGGYRIHPKGVVGSPDIAFLRQRVAIFVDGCFWHRCPKCYRSPTSNVEFWSSKAVRNVERDRRVDSSLAAAGWTVLRVWEHEIRESPETAYTKVRDALAQSTGRLYHLGNSIIDQTNCRSQCFDEELADNGGGNGISEEPVGMTHSDAKHKSVRE